MRKSWTEQDKMTPSLKIFSMNLTQHVHRRYNPLLDEWLLVSPHRGQRPWQGQEEDLEKEQRPAFDPSCYLCPGVQRANGNQNPEYDTVFVFDNDFAALKEGDAHSSYSQGLLQAESESGICRVICFSPRHDLTLADMDTPAIEAVVDVWCEQYEELASRPDIGYVQIFENKGAIMGCSNPHPHGQIWAQRTVPDLPARESIQQERHFKANGSTLLQDYLDQELKLKERIVCENDYFVVLVPFWAFWPYETLLLPRRPVPNLLELTPDERHAFADILRRLTIRYDNLFGVSFPYSAGIHQSPTDGQPHPEWHLHMHFYPPLFRSATIKKFRVGYEMLAMLQRDVSAEVCAGQLREP